MDRKQAIDWCMRNDIDISFRPEAGHSRVRLQWGSQQIEAPELSQAVRMMRTRHEAAQGVDPELRIIPLAALDFGKGMCRGRIMRLAEAIRVETVGELLAWAEEQSDGLQAITRYRNVGERSFRALRAALERVGVEEMP